MLPSQGATKEHLEGSVFGLENKKQQGNPGLSGHLGSNHGACRASGPILFRKGCRNQVRWEPPLLRLSETGSEAKSLQPAVSVVSGVVFPHSPGCEGRPRGRKIGARAARGGFVAPPTEKMGPVNLRVPPPQLGTARKVALLRACHCLSQGEVSFWFLSLI